MKERAGLVGRLQPFFDLLDVGLDGCPVQFSVALPNGRARLEWPTLPAAAMPKSGRIASGRGLDREACALSAFGEAAELLSCCGWGNETVVTASAIELGEAAFDLDDLLGLSDVQVSQRAEWNATFGLLDWRPRRLSPHTRIDWLETHDALSGNTKFVPADAVLVGRREVGDNEAVAIADSNGCASGEDLVGAKLAAILELVERDAVARWWYGRRNRPRINLERLTGADDLVAYLKNRRRRCLVIDVTSDLNIPAAAAVSFDPDGSDVAVGSSASCNQNKAVCSALTEMLQMEISLEIARETPQASPLWDRWRREVSMSTSPLCLVNEAPGRDWRVVGEGPSEQECLDACLAAAFAVGVSVHFLDMTRAVLGVPAVRALSSELCHFKPRFARQRLLAMDSRDLARPDETPVIPNPQLLLV